MILRKIIVIFFPLLLHGASPEIKSKRQENKALLQKRYPNLIRVSIQEGKPIVAANDKKILQQNHEKKREIHSIAFSQKRHKAIQYIIEKVKDTIVQQSITMVSKNNLAPHDIITLPETLQVNTAIFSPNQKMIAVGAGSEYDASEYRFLLYTTDKNKISNNRCYQHIQSIHIPVTHIAFSPTNKSILVGCNNQERESNLFLFTIDSDGIIKDKPDILDGNSESIQAIAFHPHGQCIVSASNDEESETSVLLLRKINSKGKVEKAHRLDTKDIGYIKKVFFTSNGESLLCVYNKNDNSHHNHIARWNFKQDGSLQANTPIILRNHIKMCNEHLSFSPDLSRVLILRKEPEQLESATIPLYTLITEIKQKILSEIRNFDFIQLSKINKILKGMPDISLANIPYTILLLLKKLGLIKKSPEKQSALESELKSMRRYFTQPSFKQPENGPASPTEQYRTNLIKAIQTLKDIYTDENTKKEAFAVVVQEMKYEYLLE